jgi:hypothetical protein
MCRRWIATISCGLILGMFLYPIERSPPPSGARRHEPSDPELVPLGATLAARERKRERPLAVLHWAPDTRSQDGGRSAEPLDGEQFMATVFTSRSDDPIWARDAEEMIRGKLRDELPPGSLTQAVECRAQLCRIATVHPAVTALEDFHTHMFGDPNTRIWNDANALTLIESTEREGELIVVSYLAREGDTLPSQP